MLAWPLASVTAVVLDSVAVAPPTVPAAKVTVTSGTGLPEASVTVTRSGAAKAVLIFAVCGVPLVAVTVAAAPGRLRMAKMAGVGAFGVEAVTLNRPATLLAVRLTEATPEAL